MRYLPFLALLFGAHVAAVAEYVVPPKPFGPTPSARLMAWHRATPIYGLVCYSTNTYTEQEWGYGDTSANVLDPTHLDTDQWAEVSRDAGMKGLILVAKHHNGFCLWPTKTTEYSVKRSPWKKGHGDIVKNLAESCQKYGLKFGLYCSPWDRNHAAYGRAEYVKAFHAQWRELLTSYGPLFEVWFDGANGGTGYYGGARERRNINKGHYYDYPVVWDLIRQHQPGAVIFSAAGPDIRWIGNEAGSAGETCWATILRKDFATDDAPPDICKRLQHGDEGGTHYVPAEADFPLRRGWYWHTQQHPKALAHLIDVFFASVGRNASMDIGIAINKQGLIDKEDADRLRQFGAFLRHMFATDVAHGNKATSAQTRGKSAGFAAANVTDDRYDTYWATDDRVHNGSLTIDLRAPTTFNVIELQEYVPLGQRVGAWSVEALVDNRWREIGRGTTIGFRRLLRIRKTRTTRVRINVLDAMACPTLAHVGLFRAPDAELGPEQGAKSGPTMTPRRGGHDAADRVTTSPVHDAARHVYSRRNTTS